MITSQVNKNVIVFDSSTTEEERIKELLQSKRFVVAINMHSIFPKFHKINELVGNYDFVKYFYGGNEKFYEEMINKFTIKRGEIIYMGEWFKSSMLI